MWNRKCDITYRPYYKQQIYSINGKKCKLNVYNHNNFRIRFANVETKEAAHTMHTIRVAFEVSNHGGLTFSKSLRNKYENTSKFSLKMPLYHDFLPFDQKLTMASSDFKCFSRVSDFRMFNTCALGSRMMSMCVCREKHHQSSEVRSC